MREFPIELELQFRLSNGNWADCGDRTGEFLQRCLAYSSAETMDQLVEDLEKGNVKNSDDHDWYSFCRVKPEPIIYPEPEMVTCACGCSVPKGSVMSTSMGSSCDDCYDRMSI